MKTHSILLTCAALTGGLFLASPAEAAISFSLTDSIGNPNSVQVSPGDTFNIRLQITSTEELLTGLSFNLEAFGLASGQFRITGRTVGTSPFSDLTTDNSIALQAASALLDPLNNTDLGATIADVFSPVGPGTFLVADYTIQALPGITPFANYTIGTANGIATDDSFNDNPIVPIATYDVQVIPEPGTAVFGLICLGALSGRRRRVK